MSQHLQKNTFETDAKDPRIHYITTAPLSPGELPPGLADSTSTRKQLGIGQRAILLETSHGNVLWDCIAFLNPETIDFINEKGGLKAIVISHPHFYTTHLEWADTFGCPVYMASVDQEWVNRGDEKGVRKLFGTGETKIEEVKGELSVVVCGGHFEGSSVFYWETEGKLFIADTFMSVPSGFKNAHHIPDTTSYSFMWAYPNMIPLTPRAIMGIWNAIKGLQFNSTYGGFPGQNLSRPDLKKQVLESMKIFLRRGGHVEAEIYGESV
ncbi:metallo-beta-lactamase family [Pyrenophora seminiperda CCB06]|uniref:Metallo-beta-lactamase family n=1 Tax=Pyrenophora seminiperda CCB06 TaxID=1302712 RepID=A0A3M7LWJ9_9PLEO|nr:metallo-beta-lactamase family [Pyrenophora seminiperda CCB06]